MKKLLTLLTLVALLGACGKAATTTPAAEDPNAPSSRGPAAEPYSTGPTSPQPK